MKTKKPFTDQEVDLYYDEVRKQFFFLTHRLGTFGYYSRLQYKNGVVLISNRRKMPRKIIKLDSFIEDQLKGEKDANVSALTEY